MLCHQRKRIQVLCPTWVAADTLRFAPRAAEPDR